MLMPTNGLNTNNPVTIVATINIAWIIVKHGVTTLLSIVLIFAKIVEIRFEELFIT